MRAGFGEAALAYVPKGKARLIVLWECHNVAWRGDMFAIALPEVVVKVAHLTVEAFVLSGSSVARIAGSAKSSPNRRALEAIMNCSVLLYSTRSIIRDDGVFWACVEMGCHNWTQSSLVYMSKSSKAL